MIVATRTYSIEILCNHAWSTRIRFRTVVPNTRRLLLSEPYAFPPGSSPRMARGRARDVRRVHGRSHRQQGDHVLDGVAGLRGIVVIVQTHTQGSPCPSSLLTATP